MFPVKQKLRRMKPKMSLRIKEEVKKNESVPKPFVGNQVFDWVKDIIIIFACN